MRKPLQFLKEAYAELQKVIWPTRARAARLTLIVVVVTIAYGAFIAGVDFGLSKGVQSIITSQKSPSPAPLDGQGQPVPGGQGKPVPVQPGQEAPVQIPGQPQPGQ